MKIIHATLALLMTTSGFIWGESSTNKENENASINQTLDFAKRHQEFRNLHFEPNEAEFVRLVREGQNPQTLFIGCSDSRVVPDLILNSKPGDLFVVRTAGNFVVPNNNTNCLDGVIATIQYGVEVVGTKHIIVCGHSHCGAIEGLFKPLDPKKLNYVINWLKVGHPAKKLTLETISSTTPANVRNQIAEQVSVVYQLKNLMTYPFISERVNDGSLKLHGWYFDIETGEISYYDEKCCFKPLK